MERLKDDTDLEEAIKVLQNPVRYREILSAPVKKDEPAKKEQAYPKQAHGTGLPKNTAVCYRKNVRPSRKI
jgi:hypothetical protein